MNLTINNTAFNGKREVIYGLKNAAREAKQAELFKSSSFGPRPINKSQLVKERKEVLRAYIDMTVFDDSFEKTIEELPYHKDGKLIKEMLKPQSTQWGEINPRQVFENSLTETCTAHQKTINTNFLKFLK